MGSHASGWPLPRHRSASIRTRIKAWKFAAEVGAPTGGVVILLGLFAAYMMYLLNLEEQSQIEKKEKEKRRQAEIEREWYENMRRRKARKEKEKEERSKAAAEAAEA